MMITTGDILAEGVGTALRTLGARGAAQQPDWPDRARLREVRRDLAGRPPIVRPDEVAELRSVLAGVAAGESLVLQAGDCAEDPAESTLMDVTRKAGLLDMLAGSLMMTTQTPVVRVGRIAGQFAKPRSEPTERVGDRELPVYRGHLVNGPESDVVHRTPDPDRLRTGYQAAHQITDHLGWHGDWRRSMLGPPLWTSHEALLLDYELPMTRPDPAGRLVLTSTHWPWIGNRTRQLDGAHVALLSAIANPVACKVGPTMTVDELLRLCERLDPHREPARLTLIARMGASVTPQRLAVLVDAVRRAGHPVIWLSDPMHGNTSRCANGLKTRFVATLAREVQDFRDAVAMGGGRAGGLHLEATPHAVTECVADESVADQVGGGGYTTLCDPRLNPEQALSLCQPDQALAIMRV